jgi:hypothetical protein
MRTNMSKIVAFVGGIAGAGLVLTGCAGGASQAAGTPTSAAPSVSSPASLPAKSSPAPAPASPPAAPVTSPKPKAAAPADKILGPRGYGTWVLGMSRQAVLKAGGLVEDGSDGTTCAAYRTKDGARIVVSAKFGLVSVEAPPGARTPEGIRPGSTVKDVKAKYPNAQEYRYGFTVSVRGSAFYSLESAANRPTDKVNSIAVLAESGDCMLALY